MLMVLSEIDCLSYIQSMGVYPDSFFTDFDTFQHHVVVKDNADIIIILAGTCSFSKRAVEDYITTLIQRKESKTDTGIRSIRVMSDTVLKKTNDYYLYDTRPDYFYHVVGGKKGKTLEDVWGLYRSDVKDCAKYLDRTDLDLISSDLKKKHDRDDELLSIIQIPHLCKR